MAHAKFYHQHNGSEWIVYCNGEELARDADLIKALDKAQKKWRQRRER